MEGINATYGAEVMGGFTAIKAVFAKLVFTPGDINIRGKCHHRAAHPAKGAVAAQNGIKAIDKINVKSDSTTMALSR